MTEHQIAIKEAQHKGWMIGYTEAWNNARNGDLPSRPPLDAAGNPWKSAPEEPTGDVWVSLDGKWPLFHRQSDGDWDAGYWTNHDGYEMPWAELLSYFGATDVQIYRREFPQSDGAGALPTSPSPEVGVATSPPASSPEEPQEFGSVVRASSVRYEEQNWTPIPRTGEHWWHSETGKLEMWRDLIDPEVLRIGVGTDALRSVLLEKITALQDRAITGVEKYQLGLALDAVRAEL